MSLKEQDIVMTTVDADGNTVIQLPITRIENVEGAPRTINQKAPDASGNIDIPSRHVGDEWHSLTGKTPAGGVPYCGQIVTRATYADLWAYVQAQGLVKTEAEWDAAAKSKGGNVPFYSSGDDSTTFRMPKMEGYIKGASVPEQAGTHIAEGLPNITGSFFSEAKGYYSESYSGAFYQSDESKNYSGIGDSDSDDKRTIFDASRSSPIYGNSSHVTPETVHVLFGVYAFGEITNTGALDAETLASSITSLELEVDKQVKAMTSFVKGAFPEVSGAQIDVIATPDNGVAYEYTMTTDGMVDLSCQAGCGRQQYSYSPPDDETTYWYEYKGASELTVTANGYALHPFTSVSGNDQVFTGHFFLRKGQKIAVTCKRTTNANANVPHKFSAKIIPHILNVG